MSVHADEVRVRPGELAPEEKSSALGCADFKNRGGLQARDFAARESDNSVPAINVLPHCHKRPAHIRTPRIRPYKCLPTFWLNVETEAGLVLIAATTRCALRIGAR